MLPVKIRLSLSGVEMATVNGKILLLLLEAFSMAQDSCMEEVLRLREQMQEEKVVMESKMDMMAANIERLAAEAAEAKLKSAEIQAKVKDIQAVTGQAMAPQAEMMVCAYRLTWTDTGTITYSKILTQFDNCDQAGGGCGAMDISTGIFTAITPGKPLTIFLSLKLSSGKLLYFSTGIYSVTFSGRSVLYEGARDKITLHLHHNGHQVSLFASHFAFCLFSRFSLCPCPQVTESLWQSYCGEGCGRINDQASRTLVRD